jgi:hypothetical protein
MTDRAATDRRNKQAERARKRAAGLVPLEVWCLPQHKDAIRKVAHDMTVATPPTAGVATPQKGKE